MFADAGVYEACGIFSIGHLNLLGMTIIGIILALKYSLNKTKEEIYQIIRRITIVMCVLEVLKILYTFSTSSIFDFNSYIPLYYCSMLLYAGLLSSFGKGKWKRAGDVFLATGAAIGGIVFLIYPSTSLPTYPAFHFISMHSFLFHGIMLYLGILVNKTHYVKIEKSDILYFAGLVGCVCIAALICNLTLGSNLMFISYNFPGLPIEIIYNLTKGSFMFTIIMSVGQMTIPFYLSYFFMKYVENKRSSEEERRIIC